MMTDVIIVLLQDNVTSFLLRVECRRGALAITQTLSLTLSCDLRAIWAVPQHPAFAPQLPLPAGMCDTDTSDECTITVGHADTCQYLEQHLSTQLFSPMLNVPSLSLK